MSRSWLLLPLLLLYLLNLGGTGFIGPDEPRYASIGREMAHSGDWITPKLEGQPWFEKPPLVYWAIAMATKLGFRDEWAARIPISLASLLFLWFFYGLAEREYSQRVATSATAILATSAGWLAYSFSAVMDLPLAVTFGTAMLVTLFDTRKNKGYVAGAFLGLSILAKGLLPLGLFFPVWLIARRRRVAIVAVAAAVALPWYIASYLKHGAAFWNELFWKHHVERLYSSSIQHVEPVYFYIPVLLAGLFPWSPLVALLGNRKLYDDFRIRFLAAWVALTFLFFSLVVNKLPGYLMPILPPLALVLAVAIDKAKVAYAWVAGCSVLLAGLPLIGAILPGALQGGLRRTPIPWNMLGLPALPALAVAGVIWWLGHNGRLTLAVLIAALAAAVGAADLKLRILPALDARASVRPFFKAHTEDVAASTCVDAWVNRGVVYGLEYYGSKTFGVCPEHGAPSPRVTAIQGNLVIAQGN